MSSVLRFDEWQDSEGNTVYDGSAFGPIGGILQVVSTIKTDTFSTTSASFTDVTGLTATITPSSASSKILILLSMNISSAITSGNGPQYKISGGNTATFVGDASGSRTRAVGGIRASQTGGTGWAWNASLVPVNATFLDSPNTTSATTYAAQVQINADTLYVNRSEEDADVSSHTRGASSITLMEVAV